MTPKRLSKRQFARLVPMLEEAATRAADHYSLETLNPKSSQYRLTRYKSVASSPDVAKIADLLADSQGWPRDQVIPLSTSPAGGSGLRLEHFAQWLIAQARERPPVDVVEALSSFLAANAVPEIQVLALWGFEPAEPVELGNKLRLIPIDELPPSQAKDSFMGVPTTRFHQPDEFILRPRPRAALVRDLIHQPVFLRSGNAMPAGNEVEMDLRDIARCLVVALQHPLFPVGGWYQCDEMTPIIGGSGGWAGMALYARFNSKVPRRPVDGLAASELVNLYLHLKKEVRDSLRVPLEWLNRAFLSEDPVDIALELGIALESLLCPDKAPEIGYRLRYHGALLRGGSPTMREETAKLLSTLYDYRSKAAHSGKLDASNLGKSKASRLHELLQEGRLLCAVLIRRIISMGRMPKWDALILGTETLD